MKKMLLLVLAFILILGSMTFTQTFALMPELIATQSLNDTVVSDEYIYYFDTPSRNEYQLSQDELTQSTEDLVELILDYPYWVDFIGSSTPDEVYQYHKLSFNGFAELETRADAATVLLSKLLDATTVNNEEPLKALYLSSILSIPSYFDNLSEQEMNSYFNISNTDTVSCNINVEPRYTKTFEETESYSDSNS